MSEMKIEGPLSENFRSIIESLPDEVKGFMRKEARDFRKFVKKRARTAVGRITGNYLRGFAAGKKVYKWSDAEYNILVFNRAPHNHLIELGHELVGHRPNKVKIGRVKAYEVINNAMKEWEDTFESDVENTLIDYVVKEIEK
ncbi:MAG: HK97 gp10 family phage protein [Firmicutes bacterium]|jgi:hypothetical protein|nr:HK97 gp10 family phage protein [Bacillota bacterium]